MEILKGVFRWELKPLQKRCGFNLQLPGNGSGTPHMGTLRGFEISDKPDKELRIFSVCYFEWEKPLRFTNGKL